MICWSQKKGVSSRPNTQRGCPDGEGCIFMLDTMAGLLPFATSSSNGSYAQNTDFAKFRMVAQSRDSYHTQSKPD